MSVSSGKRERSTVVPARAPARRAVWKAGGEEEWVDILEGCRGVCRGLLNCLMVLGEMSRRAKEGTLLELKVVKLVEWAMAVGATDDSIWKVAM